MPDAEPQIPREPWHGPSEYGRAMASQMRRYIWPTAPNTAWADRILARHKAGESIMPYPLMLAEQVIAERSPLPEREPGSDDA